MQHEQPSIFDQNFPQETYIRRRRLMSPALKVLVWFFLIVSALAFLRATYSFFRYELELVVTVLDISMLATLLINPLLLLLDALSNLFILLGKKWAIGFALIITSVNLLFWGSFLLHFIGGQWPLFIKEILIMLFCILVRIPYIVMLLRIKRDWETKAVAGNHSPQT
jgi:hypothetical protein